MTIQGQDPTAEFACVPLQWIGPVRMAGPEVEGEIHIPLATYESPLWPSVARGARVTAEAGGIRAVLLDDRMTRSILLEAPDAVTAATVWTDARQRQEEIAAAVAETGRFVRLLDLYGQIAGSLLFVRLACSTGDAAGHNMTTLAAERVLTWFTDRYPSLSYVSISGNLCTDKKTSAVNGLLGRGKSVIAEAVLPGELCLRRLHATPEALAALNLKKNLIGSILAGSLRSGNAHVANMLLAFYLATGQDAANIVEGSQALTQAEAKDGALRFSCTLPNLVVGAVGNGKDLPFVRENLRRLGCLEERTPGANGRRLAAICAAAVLCGELSLLAAQTRPGELMRAHRTLERGKRGSPSTS